MILFEDLSACGQSFLVPFSIRTKRNKKICSSKLFPKRIFYLFEENCYCVIVFQVGFVFVEFLWLNYNLSPHMACDWTTWYFKNFKILRLIFFWCAPFGYLYFLSFLYQNWVLGSILAWLWHHFHLASESNPRPSNREPSALPLDHSFRRISRLLEFFSRRLLIN